MNADITSLAQFGFAAVAAAALWLFIKELIPKLMEANAQLAKINGQLVTIVDQNSRALEAAAVALRDLGGRVGHLEQQHEQTSECPFGAWQRKQEEGKR